MAEPRQGSPMMYSGSTPDDQPPLPPQQARSFFVSKVGNSWEEGSSTMQHRSPLAQDRSTSASQRSRPSFSEQSARRSGAPTHSSLPASRSLSSRQAKDRTISVAVGRPRSPYASSFRFFLTVVPPVDLPQDPPHPRSQPSAISSTHTRRGTLLPLYPTLGGQLYAISREYGLPSIGGLALYLCDDGEGNLGPRVGDAAWTALWSRYFDESAEELYQEITSPIPSRTLSRQESHERHFSGTSSEVHSPFPDRYMSSRREADNSMFDEAGAPRYEEERRPSSSAMKLPPFANGYPASPSAVYHTPSPRHAKLGRPASRSSLYTAPVSSQARLPIVGRVEWAVDKRRAPWWSSWIGEADMSSERSTVNAQGPIVTSASEAKTGRRSMHLASSLNKPRAASPLRSIPVQNESILPELELAGTASGGSASFNRDEVGENNADEDKIDMNNVGYQQIGDEDVHLLVNNLSPGHVHDVAAAVAPRSRTSLQSRGSRANGLGYDAQSYAGYSALLGVDDESRTRDGASTRTGDGDGDTSLMTSASRLERDTAFDAHALSGNDEALWQGLQEELEASQQETSPSGVHRLSARSLSKSPGPDAGSSVVHRWIVNTQSPTLHRGETGFAPEQGEEEEEALLPPEDDVGEVLGLWAEKAKGDELPIISRPDSFVEEDQMSTDAESEREESDSVSRQSPRFLKRGHQTGTLESSLPEQPRTARLGEFPQTNEPTTSAQGRQTISKASLLSPIALDGSPGMFAGPSADLATLLGTRNTLAPESESRQSTIDSQAWTSTRQMGSQYADGSLQRQYSLSSPRLEVPSPRSPGAQSHRSSSTETSDTLLDMERALALLSPAISNAQYGSPGLGPSTADTTYDGASLSASNRSRLPMISSRESMAKAKTLSTSVTPSPRWFRNATVTMPQVPASDFATTRSRFTSAERGLDEQEAGSSDAAALSSRPMSAFASTQHQSRPAGWQLQPPASATRLVKNLIGQERRTSRSSDSPVFSRTSHQSTASESSIIDHLQGQQEEFSRGESADSGKSPKVGALTSDKKDFAHFGTQSKQGPPSVSYSHALPAEESTPMYDSPIEMEAPRSPFLQPGDTYGRQGWSNSTVEQSGRGVSSRLSSQVMPLPASPQLGGHIQDAGEAGQNLSSSINASFSPRSGQYATVGVQAERTSMSRTESVFSLVSDDAASSEVVSTQDEAVEAPIAENAPVQEVESREEEEAADTPVVHSRDRMGEPVAEEGMPPSIERLLRANSFAESSVTSSKPPSIATASPHMGHSPITRNDSADEDYEAGFSSTLTATQLSMLGQDQQEDEDLAESAAGDDATTMRGPATTISGSPRNSNNVGTGQDWSQDGSEYDDDDLQGEEEEGEETNGSPATTRLSRLSGFSNIVTPGSAMLSDAGGRTPTFFYDQHLDDEDDYDRRISKRFSSGNRPASLKNDRMSQLNQPMYKPAFESHGQDALGVGLWQTNEGPLPSSEEDQDTLPSSGRTGHRSYDSSRHDIVSMQGEALNSYDDQMLNGFEQVSPEPVEPAQQHGSSVRPATANEKSMDANAQYDRVSSKTSSNEVQSEEGQDRTGNTDQARSVRSPPSSKQSPLSPAVLPLQTEYAANAPMRRSLGSVHDSLRGRQGSDTEIRRASASATSPSNKSPSSFSTSPRRLKGAMLRLASNISGGTFNGGNGHMARGTSPNQRFAALPPSPSLPPGSESASVMSPTQTSFGRGAATMGNSLHTNGSTVQSPTMTSTFMSRKSLSPQLSARTYGLDMPPSPNFKASAGASTPPSPRGGRPFPTGGSTSSGSIQNNNYFSNSNSTGNHGNTDYDYNQAASPNTTSTNSNNNNNNNVISHPA